MNYVPTRQQVLGMRSFAAEFGLTVDIAWHCFYYGKLSEKSKASVAEKVTELTHPSFKFGNIHH